MDTHHDMVNTARLAAPAGTRWYFAYSTILDRPAFEAWRAEHGYQSFELPSGGVAEAADVRVVYDFPSRFWGGRVAGLADAPGASVWGRLYEVPNRDWPVIQHKEGVITGMSVEREVLVRMEDGATRRATAFATNPLRASTEGTVSQPFVEALIRGAVSAGLPPEWIATLKDVR
jgi:gamma-glutamylcyclotransferase